MRPAVGSGRTDPSDRLSLLAARLPYSGFARDGEVYIDGFTDFTAQEKRVRCELMDRADVTLCLTLDSVDYGSELFDLARATARYFLRHAREEGIASRVEPMEAAERSPMDTLAENLLAYPARSFDAEGADTPPRRAGYDGGVRIRRGRGAAPGARGLPLAGYLRGRARL